MKLFETVLDDMLLEKLITLSEAWEAENSCYGYRRNTREDIEGNRIFLAVEGETLLGYLFGQVRKAERMRSIMEEGTPYFEIEELYVVPDARSNGIGRALYAFAEDTVKAEGLRYILLSTATKNYKSILHFYIDELGMDFWSARLYKRL